MKFEFVAGNLALDFANSVHDQGSPDPQDDLKTYLDLLDWGRQASLLSPQQCRELLRKKPAEARLEFERTLELRDAIYALFVGRARGRVASQEALQQLDWHFREAMADVTLERSGAHFALTWKTDDSLRQVRGTITRSAVDLMTSERLRRVRQCEGESCTWLFLDTSRNGLRRWCDMQACGNRAKVRRFRKKSAAG